MMVAPLTNLPVEAERLTDRLLPVPAPTRSVVVFPGHRTVVAFETNRPVLALRLTLRAMAGPPFERDPPRANHLPAVLGDCGSNR